MTLRIRCAAVEALPFGSLKLSAGSFMHDDAFAFADWNARSHGLWGVPKLIEGKAVEEANGIAAASAVKRGTKRLVPPWSVRSGEG